MHHCLQIQEIVADIVDYAYNTPNSGPRPVSEFEKREPGNYASPNHDTKTILSFALTCRAFIEPSFDALWSSQVSLIPLLSCFPSALRREGYECVGTIAQYPFNLCSRSLAMLLFRCSMERQCLKTGNDSYSTLVESRNSRIAMTPGYDFHDLIDLGSHFSVSIVPSYPYFRTFKA